MVQGLWIGAGALQAVVNKPPRIPSFKNILLVVVLLKVSRVIPTKTILFAQTNESERPRPAAALWSPGEASVRGLEQEPARPGRLVMG